MVRRPYVPSTAGCNMTACRAARGLHMDNASDSSGACSVVLVGFATPAPLRSTPDARSATRPAGSPQRNKRLRGATPPGQRAGGDRVSHGPTGCMCAHVVLYCAVIARVYIHTYVQADPASAGGVRSPQPASIIETTRRMGKPGRLGWVSDSSSRERIERRRRCLGTPPPSPKTHAAGHAATLSIPPWRIRS